MSIAEKMAANQKQVAISEFFEKNKHFLGFDTLNRALITAVKEAVDNALDACEEARILPDIVVKITKLDNKKDILQLEVEDNGPGIPRASIEKVFGQLLFGSRFHAIRQSRGQQGIGITGVVMYSQLTTGDPTHVESKIAKEATAVSVDIGLDTRKNKAIKSNQDRIDWGEKVHGLKVKTKMKAKYQRGRQSVWQYLRMTSIVNPHADILFIDPDGEKHHWQRVTERLPGRVEAIKPHPNGIELGQLQRLCSESSESRMTTFLRRTFSGVSGRAAKELCEVSELEEKLKPKTLNPQQVRALLEAFQGERLLKGKPVKLLNPPTSCLSPIEELLIKKGLSKTIDSKFVTTMTRAPSVTQGNPFQVEVGLIFGEGMAADKPVEILRFANRVPLMYQQGGCLLTKAIESVDWRQYGLDQAEGGAFQKVLQQFLFISQAPTSSLHRKQRKHFPIMKRLWKRRVRQCSKWGVACESTSRSRKRWAKPRKNSNSSTILFLQLPRNPLHYWNYQFLIWLVQLPKSCLQSLQKQQQRGTKKRNKPMFTSRSTITHPEPDPTPCSSIGRSVKARQWLAMNSAAVRKPWAYGLGNLKPYNLVLRRLSHTASTVLKKGDWNETDVFYRGSQEVIGATKMDEKLLEEIRRQEEALNAPPPEDVQEDEVDDEEVSEGEVGTSEPSCSYGRYPNNPIRR